MCDCIAGVDDILPREHVDEGVNEYGDLLIDFLVNTNMFMMNGRLPGTNDYTYIRCTWRSVIDHALIPHEQLQYYEDFNVLIMTDLINVHNLHPLMSSLITPY